MIKNSEHIKELDFSIIVPIHNEEGNITKLDSEIKASISQISPKFEIIYINDGSTDKSLAELKTLPEVKIIDLNRNYGQATALDAGFKAAEGSIIISLDGDGQNDPADFAKLLEKMYADKLDVVAGYRKNRADNKKIKILTRIGRMLRKILIGDTVHDTGCTLRAYTYEAVKTLDIQGEMHRYILALLRWKGFRIGEVVVSDRARVFGTSKYGISKSIRGFIDLMYIWFIHKYSQRPLHLFGYLSMFTFTLAGLFLSYSVLQKILFDLSINRSGHFLVGSFLMLTSIIFFCFGIIIDLLIRIQLTNSPYEKRYYIRDIIETK